MSFDFVAIDFETANNNLNSACSLGIAAVKNKKIVETKYFLIKPSSLYFSKNNININGITPQKVVNAPYFPEVWEQIKHYFNDNIIIAHNASFDMSVLKDCLIEYNLPIPDFNYICSIPISTRACEDQNVGRSLEDRANYFGIDMGQHHNSLDDAITCANLVIKCLNVRNRETLKSYCATFTSIPVKNFGDLKPQKEFKSNSKHFEKINISEIVPEINNFDKSHPFYNKIIVFTGELKSMKRKDAMQKVVNLGAVLKSSVTLNTNYLIVGIEDKTIVGQDGISSKQKRACELNKEGHNIKIINEDTFLKLLQCTSLPKNETNVYINDDTLNSMITFNSINEKIDKLKEWKLLSPKAQDLKDIYYKNKSNTYKCDIVGYFKKETNPDCINNFYESVVIKVNNDIIKILPDYLLEMQKKDFFLNSF